jgi:hypothetical protein
MREAMKKFAVSFIPLALAGALAGPGWAAQPTMAQRH